MKPSDMKTGMCHSNTMASHQNTHKVLPRQTRNSFLLVLTAFIWGTAFVAQSAGGDVVGPYSFNSIRSFIGALVLLPVICLLDRLQLTKRNATTAVEKKQLWVGGISCGILLCLGSNLQQVGLFLGTSAGKAGFLTACYILLVPILGLFLKKKCGINIWIGVALALLGLYLLCMNGSLSLQLSDTLILICALVFAIHILVIDHFTPLVDGVRMSCIQFFVCGVCTAFPMFLFEMKHSLSGIQAWLPSLLTLEAWIPLLYAGIFSCGVAYTLQIIGQQDINPTIASLILSLESVFSVLAGWIILDQKLSIREICGCVLIFVAILFAQYRHKS